MKNSFTIQIMQTKNTHTLQKNHNTLILRSLPKGLTCENINKHSTALPQEYVS